ncbi:hypothetical protein [Rhizobium sp. BR 314]|uniref:hypothetical protein n=1 Tax=Rhizobium sp. BR 314 TaxID=3040013 RepID=UPI0039BF38D0
MAITVAGQGDIRQRLNSDGLASLGLAGPLLSPVWTQALPVANVGNFSFTVAAQWYAPLAGMLITEPNPTSLGLSRLDGTPWPTTTGNAVVFRIHPQARLRLERLIVSNLQPANAGPPDRSIRPIPAMFLITNPGMTFATPWIANAGEQIMPAGDVTMYDEHGLAVDPFAFAAALAAMIASTPAAGGPAPAGAPAGTLAAIAGCAPAGNFIHAVDLHGRPWQDPPGVNAGISLYTAGAGGAAPTQGQHIGDGLVYAFPSGATIAADADPSGTQSALTTPALLRFGWQVQGRLNNLPVSWPAAGPQRPARDTMRLAVCDPTFHLLGNLTLTARDGVPGADVRTNASQASILREGSPITLFTESRSALGWIGQVILNLQGGNPAAAFQTGPMFAASSFFDGGQWPLPNIPGPNGAWPIAPAATPVPGNDANVMAALAPIKTAVANWIAGSNDVLVTLPAGLPAGVAIRFYPIQILMGVSPDEQPLLRRADGNATITTGAATDTVRMVDPFNLGLNAVRPGGTTTLRMDAALTWLTAAGAVPRVKLIGNLHLTVGADVPAPPLPPANFLASMFWRGTASNPMIGAPSRGPFPLAAALGDPIAFIQGVVRHLSTDANPREAPRLPTMSRNESLFALQLQPGAAADIYRSMLTGAFLTREADAQSPRLANPGGAGWHEVHAPSLAATSQIGFDLWIAAAHRARPVVPTADVAQVFQSGPIAGLPTNWVLLQANATSVPPAAPAAPSTIAAAVLQTVPAYVETPELAIIPDTDIAAAVNWVTTQLGNWVSTPNDPELHRQIARELRTSNYGRRDAQWALRRAIAHARELVYIETPLLAHTTHDAGPPQDPVAAVDLVNVLANRLTIEPRLRVVILVPREPPFVKGYEPFSAYFYANRLEVATTLALAGGMVDGLNGQRPRVVIGHPMGMPGRPLTIRSTTVIVDDVWCLQGTSSISRRGLTFDGATDVALVDWQMDRGACVAIRAHRKALMGLHLGVGPTPVGGGAPANSVAAPSGDWVRLHQPVSAHEAFADALAAGSNRGKLLPLWPGPDPAAPGAVIAHPADVADPDGRGGASFITTLAAALGGSSVV